QEARSGTGSAGGLPRRRERPEKAPGEDELPAPERRRAALGVEAGVGGAIKAPRRPERFVAAALGEPAVERPTRGRHRLERAGQPRAALIDDHQLDVVSQVLEVLEVVLRAVRGRRVTRSAAHRHENGPPLLPTLPSALP